MSNHDCPVNLLSCVNHPRWHVILGAHAWLAWSPGGRSRVFDFPTFTEAVAYAAAQARAEKLAAIQDGAA